MNGNQMITPNDDDTFDWEVCKECKGSGYYCGVILCVNCEGEGYVEVKAERDPDTERDIREDR